MNAPHKILVGVAFDESGEHLTRGSLHALREARTLAELQGTELTLLHSTARDQYFHPVDRKYVIVGQGVGETGRAALEGVAEEIRSSGTPCAVVYSELPPHAAIIEQAATTDADFVVVSRHDESRPEDRRMGRIAQRVVHSCPVPVFVTARLSAPEGARVVEPGDPRCFVVATDLTDVGARAVEFASFLCGGSGDELHVVHAYTLPLQVQMAAVSPEAAAEAERDLAGAARVAVKEQLEKTPHAASAKVHVGLGSPEAILKEAVEHLKPRALVLGSIGRGGVAGVVMGNTAEELLRVLDCALVVVKPEGFKAPEFGQ